MRKMTANGIVASARAGRTRCRNESHAASHSWVRMPSRTKKPVTRVASRPVLCRPETGNQLFSMANWYLSRKARKKTGTATPTSEATIDRLSKTPPRRRAAR